MIKHLKTYETTLGEYEDIVRTNLKVTNPTLLKSGSLGILTNYLATLKYDSAEYYSQIFSELNIGLAEDFKSMLFHSTIYNTDIQLATPSTFGVSFIIPEINLSDIKYLKYIIPKNKAFVDTNGIPFIVQDEITIEISKTKIKGYSWSSTSGKRELNVLRTENPKIPGSYIYLINYNNVKQYERIFYKFSVPNYDVGDAFSFSIAIQDFIMFKGVTAWYNEYPENNSVKIYDLEKTDTLQIEEKFGLQELNTKYYNYSSSRYDMDIFIDIQPTSLQFTTGNGINGAILRPGSEIIIENQITYGKEGNLPNTEFLVEDVIVQEIRDNDAKQTYAGTINGVSITGGTGGQNIESVEDIRKNIFDKITIRNSIITENDYEKAFSYNGIEPFVDAKFIDAKSFIFLFNTLKYQDKVIKTTSMNVPEIEIANDPFYPIRTYAGQQLISPFYFKRKGTNETEGYIVNPKINIDLISPATSAEIIGIENLIDISINYDFGLRKSFIRIDAGSKPGYTYRFSSSVFDCNLDYGNNFEYEVNTRFTDQYCIIHDTMRDIKIDVYDDNGVFQTTYYAFTDYHQLIRKQMFFKYYKQIQEAVGVDVFTTDDTLAYLDNALSEILAEVSTLVSSSELAGEVPYLLRIPFIDYQFFLDTPWQDFYSLMDGFFMVDKLEGQVGYNTKVAQSFYNTVDIPAKYHDFLFEQNTMGSLETSTLPIRFSVFISEQDLLLSKYNSIFDFEVAIKVKIIEFLRLKEGFKTQLFESELESILYDEFKPIIKNINFEYPSMYQVNNSDTIFTLIQENLTFDDLLDFVPPYFTYDYENIHIDVLT